MTVELPSVTENLPPLYKALTPLTAEHHGSFGLAEQQDYGFAAQSNSFPLAIDEFAAAQRHYPILFTTGDSPMPAVLVSVEQGRNPYVDDNGAWKNSAYVPAYIRRYPFMLVRAKSNNNDFALCFDNESAKVSDVATNTFFATDGQPTKTTKSIMDFCVNYEKSIDTTRRTCRELAELDILADPAIKISRGTQTLELKGFRIVDEQKLRALPAETLARLTTSGVMGAIYAHLFSLAALGQLEELSSALSKIDGKSNIH